MEVVTASLADLLHYCDFADTFQILNSHRSTLPASMGAIIRDRTDDFQRLSATRNRVAHGRPLAPDDYGITTRVAEELHAAYPGMWSALSHTLTRLQKDPAFVYSTTIRELTGDGDHNLPPPDFDETGLCGRDQEAADLIALCKGAFPVITVLGDGGLGKTALALKVAYELLDDSGNTFDAIVWTSSRTTQLTPTEVIRIKDAITDSIGVFDAISRRLAGSTRIEDPVEEVLTYLREFKILLILDNLETVLDERVRRFVSKIPLGSKVLITSRIGLGAFDYPYRLKPLEPEDAVHLLRALIRSRSVGDLGKTDNATLRGYCEKMRCNPGWMKWFVGAVQAGGRPEQILAHSDAFLDYCMSNVYEYLSSSGRSLLNVLYGVPGEHSQAELAYISEMDVDNLQRALQELQTTNFVAMASRPTGSTFSTLYSVSDLARLFLSRHHPIPTDEVENLAKRHRQLVAMEEQGHFERKPYAFSQWNIRTRSRSDLVVARSLRDAMKASENGDFDLAQSLITEAKRLAPDYFEVCRVEATLFDDRHNYPAARESFESAIELEPSWPPLRMAYARFLLNRLHDTSGALAQLNKGKELDPSKLEFDAEIARIHLYLGNLVESESILLSLMRILKDIEQPLRRKVIDLVIDLHGRQAERFLSDGRTAESIQTIRDLLRFFGAIPESIFDRNMGKKLMKALPTAARAAEALGPERGQAVRRLMWTIAESAEEWVRPISGDRTRHGTVRRKYSQYAFVEHEEGSEIFLHRDGLVYPQQWDVLANRSAVEFIIGEHAGRPCATNAFVLPDPDEQDL